MCYVDYLNHIVVLFMALFNGNIMLKVLCVYCVCISKRKQTNIQFVDNIDHYYGYSVIS